MILEPDVLNLKATPVTVQKHVMLELIAGHLGLQLNEHRQRALNAAIDKLLTTGEFSDMGALYNWLLNHDANTLIWQQIIQALIEMVQSIDHS